jgi:hypothetical protein
VFSGKVANGAIAKYGVWCQWYSEVFTNVQDYSAGYAQVNRSLMLEQHPIWKRERSLSASGEACLRNGWAACNGKGKCRGLSVQGAAPGLTLDLAYAASQYT